MRAVLSGVGGIDVLRLGEIPVPSLNSAHDLLIKVSASAVNRADILQRQGKYPPPPGASELLGLEAAGVVHEIGSGVTKYRVGDQVMALLSGGGYAEYVKCHEGHCMSIPKPLTLTTAAAVPEAYLTAFQCLFFENPNGGIQPGQRVLIHAGASGVGTAAIMLCKSVGAIPYVTCSAQKVPTCAALGAIAIPRGATDGDNTVFESKLRTVLGEGNHIDYVVDPVFGTYFNENVSVMGTDSTMVIIGFMGGSSLNKVSGVPLMIKRIKVQFSTLRNRDDEYKSNLVSAFSKFALKKI
eukprot:PhF_6_TR4434/c0_g1_i1/m.6003/K10133/TP53I3; tumor protein p53-inducible protein 3